MTVRIIYLDQGDSLEVRFVRSDLGYGRNARDWNSQSRPSRLIIGDIRSDRLDVSPMGVSVFSGFGVGRRQWLPVRDK